MPARVTILDSARIALAHDQAIRQQCVAGERNLLAPRFKDSHDGHADIDPPATHGRNDRGKPEAFDLGLDAENLGDRPEYLHVEADLLVLVVQEIVRLEIERHRGLQHAPLLDVGRQQGSRYRYSVTLRDGKVTDDRMKQYP